MLSLASITVSRACRPHCRGESGRRGENQRDVTYDQGRDPHHTADAVRKPNKLPVSVADIERQEVLLTRMLRHFDGVSTLGAWTLNHSFKKPGETACERRKQCVHGALEQIQTPQTWERCCQNAGPLSLRSTHMACKQISDARVTIPKTHRCPCRRGPPVRDR